MNEIQMTNKKAIEVLTEFNLYRRGEKYDTFIDFEQRTGFSVSEIGVAIDYAINKMKGLI